MKLILFINTDSCDLTSVELAAAYFKLTLKIRIVFLWLLRLDWFIISLTKYFALITYCWVLKSNNSPKS